MKKVGIITINDNNNYGNRLQNFATQEVLRSFGFFAETIVNNPSPTENNTRDNMISKTIIRIRNLKGLSIKDIKDKIIYRNAITLRLKTFEEFTKSYICETNYCISEQNIPNGLSNKYDYFVTGSDQVWNPYFRNGSSIDFLTFAQKQKRIAFSPSFGISEIPSEFTHRYQQWLSEMPYLSVRESAGAKIIKTLTGRDAMVLVDPTLMLTKEKWLSVAKPAKNKPHKNYLLTYFLGGVPQEHKKRIYGIAKENDLQIINLADNKDLETYIAGPSEFIDFIHSASLFCTDSFHGIVFSVLFETPFIVFDRAGNLPSMNSRIETVLSTFKLESRHALNIKDEYIFDADYSHVGSILENERNRALNYLIDALDVNIKNDSNNSKPKEVVLG